MDWRCFNNPSMSRNYLHVNPKADDASLLNLHAALHLKSSFQNWKFDSSVFCVSKLNCKTRLRDSIYKMDFNQIYIRIYGGYKYFICGVSETNSFLFLRGWLQKFKSMRFAL